MTGEISWLPILLVDPSPCLRSLVLRELFHKPSDDEEVLELAPLRESDRLRVEIVSLQESDGSWKPNSLASGRQGSTRVLMTANALTRLGYLGFDSDNLTVQRAANFLYSQQSSDGSWPLAEEIAITDGNRTIPPNERYSIIPLQTVFPLRGLAMCGYATDARSELAYEWLLSQRLADGAWPTGIAGGNPGVYGFVGGYRRLAHSRWGCRSNTTGALICLSLHPQRCTSQIAHQALDLILGRETREAYSLGFEVARMVGAEDSHGFLTYFARFDLALILDLCGRVGASINDERVSDLVKYVLGLRGDLGLWNYSARPQISRWLTFDLLRSLERLEVNTDWFSKEPRTPFQSYPKKERRF